MILIVVRLLMGSTVLCISSNNLLNYQVHWPPTPATHRKAARQRSRRQQDVWAYSDSSMNKEGNTGGGWTVYQGTTILSEDWKNRGRWMEIANQ